MVANKGIICTKIGCRLDEKHQMRQPPCLLEQELIRKIQSPYTPEESLSES